MAFKDLLLRGEEGLLSGLLRYPAQGLHRLIGTNVSFRRNLKLLSQGLWERLTEKLSVRLYTIVV